MWAAHRRILLSLQKTSSVFLYLKIISLNRYYDDNDSDDKKMRLKKMMSLSVDFGFDFFSCVFFDEIRILIYTFYERMRLFKINFVDIIELMRQSRCGSMFRWASVCHSMAPFWMHSMKYAIDKCLRNKTAQISIRFQF